MLDIDYVVLDKDETSVSKHWKEKSEGLFMEVLNIKTGGRELPVLDYSSSEVLLTSWLTGVYGSMELMFKADPESLEELTHYSHWLTLITEHRLVMEFSDFKFLAKEILREEEQRVEDFPSVVKKFIDMDSYSKTIN